MPILPAKPHLASLGTRFTIETLHNRELCINAQSRHRGLFASMAPHTMSLSEPRQIPFSGIIH